jgi:hypothetical protein
MSFMGVSHSIEPVVRRILWGVALLVASVGILAGLALAYQWSVVAFVAACLLVPVIALVTGARTWRGPAYRRKRAVLLVNAFFGAVYSVPWVLALPGRGSHCPSWPGSG